MDINQQPGFHPFINNEKHHEALKVIAAIPTIEELGRVAITFFEADVVTLESQQVLAYFSDNEAHPLIQEDERFDRDMFRATLLFALATIDEATIPEVVNHFRSYWTDIQGVGPENYRALFGRYHKQPRATPYDAMDGFVLFQIADYMYGQLEKREHAQADKTANPLQEEIDGKPWKISGMPEQVDVDSLTRQFARDLRRLFPHTVVQELEVRYTPDLDEAGIFALIETIEHERAHNILPNSKDLVEPYKYHSHKLLSPFRLNIEENRSDAEFEAGAIKRIEFLRSKEARQQTLFTYIAHLDEWVTWTETDPEDGNPVFVETAYVGVLDVKIRDLTTEEYRSIFQSGSAE